MDKNGYIVFKFKTFFVRLIQSIDPNFNENEIKEALYVTCDGHDDNGPVNYSIGLIFAKTSEAAFNIENLLHNREVADFFSRLLDAKTVILRLTIVILILGWNFNGLKDGEFQYLSVRFNKASVDDFQLKWTTLYQNSMSRELFKSNMTFCSRNHGRFVPSWMTKKTD